MKTALILLFALVASFAAAADPEVDEGIIVLNDGNFAEYIGSTDRVLVEFYAPWCGHCKKLAPEYVKAAAELDGNPPLAKVDCTAEKDTCGKYGVRGYPTLKYFTNGDAADYSGGRDAQGIVSWLSSRMKPAVQELENSDAVDAFKSQDGINVIFFGKDSGSFASAAESLRDDASFGQITDADLAKSLGVESLPALSMFRTFDEPRVNYDGDFTENAIKTFVVANSFPLVGEIGPENYSKYMERGLPLLWLSIKPDDESHKAIIEAARGVAKDFTSSLSFVYLDGIKYESHMKNLGLSTGPPGAIIVASPKKYVHPSGDITADTLRKFATAYDAGELTPFMKSQEIPETNDEPVKVVVGKSFDDIVLDETKDVLVEFYAPWCGHCKKLAPIYDKLGEEFADVENVVIAKMDSTENDGPIEISGFPTLYFFPAGGKKEIKYSGERTQEAMSEFIRKHASTATKDEL